MRIAIVTDAWLPQVNGVVRTMMRMVDELGRRGHQLQVISPDLSQIAPWGLTLTSSMKALGQVAGGVGGPIVKDRLWFYAQAMTNTTPKP